MVTRLVMVEPRQTWCLTHLLFNLLVVAVGIALVHSDQAVA